MFSGLRIANSGMSAERVAMDVTAQNIANAETTRTTTGGAYQRRVAQLEAVLGAPPTAFGPTLSAMGFVGGVPSGGVRVAGIATDTSPGAMVYSPGHPDADKSGYVRLPNINLTEELLSFKESTDSFQANSTVFQAISSMLKKAVKI